MRTRAAARRGAVGQEVTQLSCGLLRQYQGADQGLMTINPQDCQEWAYIPTSNGRSTSTSTPPAWLRPTTSASRSTPGGRDSGQRSERAARRQLAPPARAAEGSRPRPVDAPAPRGAGAQPHRGDGRDGEAAGLNGHAARAARQRLTNCDLGRKHRVGRQPRARQYPAAAATPNQSVTLPSRLMLPSIAGTRYQTLPSFVPT